MAKTSAVQRNLKRIRLAKRFKNKRDKLKKIIRNKKLPLEESIMTKIHTEDRDKFNDITFQVWNHEDSGDVFKKIIRGKKMFYNTFEELNQ